MKVIDLFAGAGGMSQAFRLALPDAQVVGLENWEPAIETARKAGHVRVERDLMDLGVMQDAPAHDWLHASPPCFAAGTPVLTQRGSLNIEDVSVGDEVLTHRNRWRKVTATMSRMAETVSLGPVVCTPDHRFYARSLLPRPRRGARKQLGDPCWVAASDLKGAFIASPLAISTNEHAHWECDPWLAGRYVADGWVSRGIEISIAVGLGKSDEFIAETNPLDWRVSASGASCDRYTKSGRALADWLVSNFKRGAHNKTLPNWLFHDSTKNRQRFLAGYLSGDGSQRDSGWRAVTVSSNLASQLRLLALSLGFTSQVSRTVTAPTAVIEGRVVNQRDYYTVDAKPNDGRYTYSSPTTHWSKRRKGAGAGDRQMVYDLSVDEDHSFTAWGFFVHNCQGFSMQGKGAGRADFLHIIEAIEAIGSGRDPLTVFDELRSVCADPRSALTLIPMAWISWHRPHYVTLEQVPTAITLWEAYGKALEKMGYSGWVAKLSSEQYGVPQTRKRAFLGMSLEGEPAMPPPTHSRYYSNAPERLDEGVEKWVSMAEAIGNATPPTETFTPIRGGAGVRDPQEPTGGIRGGRRKRAAQRATHQPSPTVLGGQDPLRWVFNDQSGTPYDEDWPQKRPATTVAGRMLVANPGATANRYNGSTKSRNDGIVVQPWEAGVLQSFPADYPWTGTVHNVAKQIGNSVPPLMGAAVIRSLTERKNA